MLVLGITTASTVPKVIPRMACLVLDVAKDVVVRELRGGNRGGKIMVTVPRQLRTTPRRLKQIAQKQPCHR